MVRELRVVAVVAAAAILGAPVGAVAQAPEAAGLAGTIREAVARLRAQATAGAGETGVVATVADIIVTAAVAPPAALGAVRLAIAQEGCVFEQEQWNRWGCAGLAEVASAIEGAIGDGPAATGGEGGAPISQPPQFPGGGADYRPPVGG